MNIENFNEAFIKLQFSGARRIKIYEALASYLENGVSLRDALDLLYNHASDDGKKPSAVNAVAISAWRVKYRSGAPLGMAVKGWVPERDQILISAGDKSDLISALRNAAFMQESIGRIKSAVMGGLLYPVGLLLGLFAMFTYFSFNVIPTIETIVARDQWVGSVAALGAASDFVRSYIIVIAAGVIGLIATVVVTLPRWTGKVRIKFDRFPPWSLYRLIQGTGFMLALSSLIRAGIPDHEVLRILARSASPWYAERLHKTLRITLNGHSVGEALYLAGQDFPDREVVRELRAFSQMNRFEEMLERMSHRRVEEDVKRVQGQAGMLRNIGLGLVGGVLAWMISSIAGLVQMAMQTAA